MPDRFISLETGKPFSHCCACKCELAEAGMHIVNQSFVKGECVFELAMCMECREDMNAKLSEDSRVAMFDFMHDNTNMQQREEELGTDSDTEAYLAKCISCDAESKDLSSYTIGGMFSDKDLVKGPFPLLMCSACEENLSETISEETRNMWDKFIGEHFPGPPSHVELPTGSKPLFM